MRDMDLPVNFNDKKEPNSAEIRKGKNQSMQNTLVLNQQLVTDQNQMSTATPSLPGKEESQPEEPSFNISEDKKKGSQPSEAPSYYSEEESENMNPFINKKEKKAQVVTIEKLEDPYFEFYPSVPTKTTQNILVLDDKPEESKAS